MSFFVILENRAYAHHKHGEPYPRFALVQDDVQTLATYPTEREAHQAADRTLFGREGWYEIYDTDRTA